MTDIHQHIIIVNKYHSTTCHDVNEVLSPCILSEQISCRLNESYLQHLQFVKKSG